MHDIPPWLHSALTLTPKKVHNGAELDTGFVSICSQTKTSKEPHCWATHKFVLLTMNTF